MHGTVLVDENDESVGRAIIWADQRSVAEVAALTDAVGRESLASIAGTPAATGFMGPTLLWLKEHQPERLKRSRHVLLPKDYIRLRMTGAAESEPTDASSTTLFDIANRNWSDSIIAALELPRSLFPRVLSPAQVAGALRSEQAGELGLRADIPVVAGCADQVAQAVGNGLIDPGMGSVTVGSGGQIFIPLDAPVINSELNLHVFCHAPENRWYILGATLTAGLSLRWLRDLLGLGDRADAFEYLSGMAAGVAAGSEGLLFLPYLAGERSPHMDPKARGSFVGLTLRHGAAHMARAVMEGVAFALRQVMERIVELQVQASQLIAAGNGLSSPIWRQIVADVLSVVLLQTRDRETSGTGAALLAGIGSGVYSGYDALEAMKQEKPSLTEPLDANTRLYEEQYRRYAELYPLLKPLFHDIDGSLS
jgi:xylulokinase